MPLRILLGYDGSPAANAAINVGARLFPRARVWVAHLWTPPFASTAMRDRLWTGSAHVNEFVKAIEHEGEQEARRTADTGVTLANAAGWSAEPFVVRGDSGEGLQLSELAARLDADLLLLGSRGLGGARAVLGSVSDMAVHYATGPILVVPYPLVSAEHAALATGPVLVAHDGSAGAGTAAEVAGRLFPSRELLLASVDDGEVPGQAADAGAPLLRLRPAGRYGPRGRAVAGALADCARERAAAVLVVGSRGRSAVREILLGSVAMATLHHAYRPVLVVPPADRTPRRADPLSDPEG